MGKWSIAFFAFSMIIVSACSKYTTPKKVERKISDGSWRISAFTIDGVSIQENYADYIFGFGENSAATATGNGTTINGTWEMGLNKNPAVMYMSFPPQGGMEFLADDWQVVEMQKDLMQLKRNGSSNSSNLTFTK